MKTQKEKVIAILNDWGFRSLEADEEHVTFLYQLKNIICLFDKNDETFYSVCLIDLMNYHQKDELEVLKLCNLINRNQKQVKAYILDDNRMVAAAEFYCYDYKDLADMIKIALDGITAVTIMFDNVNTLCNKHKDI